MFHFGGVGGSARTETCFFFSAPPITVFFSLSQLYFSVFGKCISLPVSTVFLYFYRTQVSLGSNLWVLMSVTHTPFADLIDVTVADEDTNSIPTNDVNRAIIGTVAMQVAPHSDQTCN